MPEGSPALTFAPLAFFAAPSVFAVPPLVRWDRVFWHHRPSNSRSLQGENMIAKSSQNPVWAELVQLVPVLSLALPFVLQGAVDLSRAANGLSPRRKTVLAPVSGTALR